MVGRAGVAARRPARRPPAVRLAAGRPGRHGRAAGPQLPRPGPRRARGARRRASSARSSCRCRPVDARRPRCSCPGASRCSPTRGASATWWPRSTEGLLRARRATCARRLPGAEPVLQLDEPSLPAVLAGAVRSSSGATTRRAGRRRPTPRTCCAPWSRRSGVPVVVHCCAARPPVGLLRRAGAAGVSVDLHPARPGPGRRARRGRRGGAGPARRPGAVGGRRPGLDVGRRGYRRAGPAALAAARALAEQRLVGQVVVTPTCGLAGAVPGRTPAPR